ncbi:MAG: hypothetical protein FWF01_01665, partial [Alphaproteobacteria bacterium]|nr:hypothetical protein [Alphaproteobacteria bacterium]
MTDDKLKPGYYLYAFANGQWSLLTSYGPEERLDALQGALFVEENEKLHTKVILVDKRTPHSKELTEKLVYTSYKSTDRKSGRSYSGQGNRRRNSRGSGAAGRGGGKHTIFDEDSVDTSATFNRAVGTLAVSVIIATVATSLANLMLSRFTPISSASLRLVSVGIFSVLFFLLSSYLFPWKTLFSQKAAATKTRKSALPEKADEPEQPPAEEKQTIDQAIAEMVDRVVGDSAAKKTLHEQTLAKAGDNIQSLLDMAIKSFENISAASNQDKLWLNLFLVGCMNRLKS